MRMQQYSEGQDVGVVYCTNFLYLHNYSFINRQSANQAEYATHAPLKIFRSIWKPYSCPYEAISDSGATLHWYLTANRMDTGFRLC